LQDQAYHQFADQCELFGIPKLLECCFKSAIRRVGAVGLLRFSSRLDGYRAFFPELDPNDSTLFLGSVAHDHLFRRPSFPPSSRSASMRKRGAMLLRPLLAIGIFSLLLLALD